MYKNLLQLPLFQGLSQADFTEIIEKVVFQFKSLPQNSAIVKQGDLCDKLIFILNGSVSKCTLFEKQDYTIEELITGPILIEPQSVFGISTTYQSSYKTSSEVDIMMIDKKYVLSELMHYSIFELNYINILSSIAHYQYKLLWEDKLDNELVSRFKTFINNRIDRTNDSVTLYIKMNDLAFQLNDTRLNVSKMLNLLEESGKVQLKRKIIYIPNPSAL